MHAQPWFLLSLLEGSEEALGGSGSLIDAPAGPQPSPCPPPADAHLLCLAACANVGRGDRCTHPQLSTELESGLLKFPI